MRTLVIIAVSSILSGCMAGTIYNGLHAAGYVIEATVDYVDRSGLGKSFGEPYKPEPMENCIDEGAQAEPVVTGICD